MEKPDADTIAMRLLCESAEDRLERIEAGLLAIERFSRLPRNAVEKLVKLQQERLPY